MRRLVLTILLFGLSCGAGAGFAGADVESRSC